MRQFVEDAHFGQGELALQQVFLQDADLSGVDAIETADGLYGIAVRRKETGCRNATRKL